MPSPDLSAELTRRIHVARRGNGDALQQAVDLAIRAAVGPENDERAWALTELGALLRRAERRTDALRALDAVLAMDASPEVLIAAFTCAVAVHCDAEDYETGRKVGESARRRWKADAMLLNALGRAYHGLYTETGWILMREERDRCFREAEALGTPA